ncbi:damage-inducible protein DinB [Rhizobium rhizogenes]|uniref:DinB family protein n=1 Tax=Rhizobium rhizogenes TaxID=359 RepID=UPI00056CD907|nr:DinB family protein [Rhizobium rhizogenes]NTF80641.1 damage-inducible protein DinB [Rhizobium rhizogenes]NTH76713.1 damage-inducible protein DinB [Rhizobium rhizogenes]NTH82721.1 damage-inducible protein DinB [Rhizobium rhizogenes]NTI21707.1 damage-inducible protein DinB [Rhizobium rhizogenes]NTI61101.1 damage-inducible protein DinB [Rhizobium rhizogenes]
MLRHFGMFAHYNRWANTLLYDAAAQLSDAEFHENRGAFFGSLRNTLNHLLVADRMWMHRFTGTGEAAAILNAIPHDALADLRVARAAEDQRIIDWVETLDDAQLAADITYSPVTRPGAITHPLRAAVAQFFNHQTHHRGQCHMTLTALGKPSLELDLIYFLRGEGRRWM